MHRRTAVAAAPLGLILLVACGDDGDPAGTATGTEDSPRTVEIDMVDIAFEPDSVDAGVGETVRFVFTNEGDLPHDAFIGDEAAQEAHEEEMHEAEEDMDGDMDDEADAEDEHEAEEDMDGDMDDEADAEDGMDMQGDGEGITVQPGDSGELTHTFDEPGETLIGCHEPGHYDAGMIVTISVS
jgi:uncharacterized cupredoxin-like copper-binding protein